MDAFLLAEVNQRVSDELAAALAALRMVKLATGSKSRWWLPGDAIDRLESFATTHHHFAARPVGTMVDAAIGIEVVNTALAAAWPAARGTTFALDPLATIVDGTTARKLTLVADRLVTNVITHGLEGRAGPLSVSLCRQGDDISRRVRRRIAPRTWQQAIMVSARASPPTSSVVPATSSPSRRGRQVRLPGSSCGTTAAPRTRRMLDFGHPDRFGRPAALGTMLDMDDGLSSSDQDPSKPIDCDRA